MRRLAVDCYACQHDRYILSGRSLAAHLTGLAVAVEHDGAQQVNERVQSWLSRMRHVEKPAVPRERGEITIADVATPRRRSTQVPSVGGPLQFGRPGTSITLSLASGSPQPTPAELARFGP